MKKIVNNIIVAVAFILLCGSCHIYKKYELPTDNAIINDYARAVQETPDSLEFGNWNWEKVFTDPLLQTYINRALENNKDLDNARLNVEVANAQLKGAKLSYLPSLSFNPNGGSASYGGSHMNWTYTLPIVASWEVDVFGKILNRKRGAQVSKEMAEAYQQATRSQIIAGVARVYYTLVLLNQQLELTKSTAEIWAEQVQTMKDLKNAGHTNEAAVVQSEANYNNLLSTIPEIEMNIHSTQNTLSLLLNTYPQDWTVTSNLDFEVPKEAIDGVPVSYLAVRPDVRAAEKAFAVAYYATNSARTNFYPSLSITAQGGFTNYVGTLIVNPGQWFVQLAGQLTAPIFMRGQNIATLEAAKAQQQIALNDFQYAVLNASSEVSDAMVELNKYDAKRHYVMLQIDNLESAVEYTQLLMTSNDATYLEVLSARSSLLSAELTSLSCWYGRVNALIYLYQSLGGGR